MNIEISFEGKKKVNANISGQIIKTDQPISSGGDGSAPTPFDLFLASIGTCAGIYVKSFCDQRNIPSEGINLLQQMEYDNENHLVSKIKIEIQLPHDFPEKYKEAVINAAKLCAVKRHLQNPPEFEIITKAV